MKSREEISAQKLRGGFYTPEPLVRFCLERLCGLLPPGDRLRLLEPSAGDGAFLRGIAADPALRGRFAELVAIEPLDLEAEKSRRSLASLGGGSVVVDSALRWARESEQRFSAAVGNPPFVRYQFLSATDKADIAALGEKAGISFAGVSNLWLPVLVAALSRLERDGVFAFVVPTELLTGLATSRLRAWPAESFSELRVDLFDPGSFPTVLQEVAVLSGRRAGGRVDAPALTLADHATDGTTRAWSHEIDPADRNWTRYLLSPGRLQALSRALASEAVTPLGALARFQVSIVTGANDFFCVSDEDLAELDLERWGKPLLPRIRHAPGLVYSPCDHIEMLGSGARGWLLDFSEGGNPSRHKGARRYLSQGEARGLHQRYKCRIREPWFVVPQIEMGSLLLSKRSHRYPRVVVNEAEAYTTDTIYRGVPRPGGVSPRALSASFHSSLTLLTAELEGRSFGGGVLELVPSEIERLAVAAVPDADGWIERLDGIARSGEEEDLVQATDDALVSAGALDPDLLEELREARLELTARRLARNERAAAAVAPQRVDVDLAA